MAASTSTARSARTCCIRGWSMRRRWKAVRPSTWRMASDKLWRIRLAAPTTQSSRVWLTISTMVRTPRPSSPTGHAMAPRYSISEEALALSPSLSFSRWISTPLRSPSGAPARDEEAAQPALRIGQGQEGVGHGGRAEPLVADQLIGARADRIGAGGVGAHVRAALLFGHCHAERRGPLLLGGQHAAVIVAGQHPRDPLGGEAGRLAQGRHRGVGHRHGTGDAALGLGHQEQQGGVGHMAALRMGPGPGGHAAAQAHRHQFMVGGVELHLVDAPSPSGRTA